MQNSMRDGQGRGNCSGEATRKGMAESLPERHHYSWQAVERMSWQLCVLAAILKKDKYCTCHWLRWGEAETETWRQRDGASEREGRLIHWLAWAAASWQCCPNPLHTAPLSQPPTANYDLFMSAADKRLDLDELAQSVAEASYESVAVAVAVAEAVSESESEVKNLNQRSELRITLPMPFAIHHSPFGAGILMNCHTHAPRGRESVKATFLWQGVWGGGKEMEQEKG